MFGGSGSVFLSEVVCCTLQIRACGARHLLQPVP